MNHPAFLIRKAAVLGAGVMGAQIAAHLANANIATILFDLPAKEGDSNGVVRKAIDGLKKLEPSPLSVADKVNYIDAANYEQNLPLLKECDLVIEAISERLDWKEALYQKIAPYLNEQAVLASNTSGLSIASLSQSCPEQLRSRFCGIHFFNPPRYMHLVELIATKETSADILDQLETFLVTTLGKGVIRAKDTPNFVANRVGVFSMLATMYHAEKLGLSFDVVDALTGPLIGRPKSATFRTADVVGLDTFAHVVKTMSDTLPDDPWHQYFTIPTWLQGLIDKGALGQKTKVGIYRKAGKEIQVLDLATQDYRASGAEAEASVVAILKLKNPAEKFAALRASPHPQAQFLWGIFRDLFHYCAYHLGDIADNARDLDLAVRWGFGWTFGPFETWQAAGWPQVTGWINEEIAAGKTMANAALPAWVAEAGREGVHQHDGSYSPTEKYYVKRSSLAVYERQLFPDLVLGEKHNHGTTIFETDAVRLWHDIDDDIAILSFKSKMHAVGADVLEGINRAVNEAEAHYRGLVIWHPEAPFSAGANLAQIAPAAIAGDFAMLDNMLAQFQQTSQRLKYSLIPTVAAVQGLALGGGCEFVMHCDRAVAALESYMGLVEVGVGLIPGGGGCKELALRASREAKGGDFFPFLQKYFQNVAMASVSKSAEQAREFGYLRTADVVLLNPYELLYVAKTQVRALAESAYRPLLPARNIPVAGKTGIATLKMILVNMREGGFISDYDYEIGSAVASALCGGEVEAGSLVDEKWLLDNERHEFMKLLRNEKTHARIEHMLKTGKPLRN